MGKEADHAFEIDIEAGPDGGPEAILVMLYPVDGAKTRLAVRGQVSPSFTCSGCGAVANFSGDELNVIQRSIDEALEVAKQTGAASVTWSKTD